MHMANRTAKSSRASGAALAAILLILALAGLAFAAEFSPDLAAPKVASSTHPSEMWVKNQTVKMAWEPVEGAENYSYVLDFNAATDPSTGTKTARTSVILNSVKDGERYFHIAACNDSGCGLASHYLVKVDITAPSTVSGLSGSPQLGGQIALSWDAQKDLSGIAEYQIFRSTYQRTNNNRDFLPTDAGVVKYTSTQTAFADSTGLKAGPPYYYRVLAVDGAGNVGAPSGVKTVRNVQESAGSTPPAQEPAQSPSASDAGPIAPAQENNAPAQNAPVQKFPNPLTDKSYAVPQGAAQASDGAENGAGTQMSTTSAIVIALLVIAGAIAAFSMMPKSKGARQKSSGHAKWAQHEGAQKAQKPPAKGKK